jgi:hypothetical protein
MHNSGKSLPRTQTAALLKTRTQTPQKPVKNINEPVLKKNMTVKNFHTATSGNIKTHTVEKDNKDKDGKTTSSARTPSTLKRSNTKPDLNKKPVTNITNTTHNDNRKSVKAGNSIPTTTNKTTPTIAHKESKVDKEVMISHLEIDTNDLSGIHDICSNISKKDSSNNITKAEDANKEINSNIIPSFKEEFNKLEKDKPNAAGVDSILNHSVDEKISTIENNLTPNSEEEKNSEDKKSSDEIISQPQPASLIKTTFSDLLIETKAVKIFHFLTKRENLLCISMNKLMGKNCLTYLYQDTLKDLEDSDYKLSQFKLKNYNDLHIPDEGFPAFVMSRGANRAIDLLNENIYNKIFTQAQAPTDDVKLIYRIFFFLVNRGDIASIEGQNEFWSACSSYIMKEGNGKTGKNYYLKKKFSSYTYRRLD